MERIALTINGTPIPAPSGVPTGLSLTEVSGVFATTLITFGALVSLAYLIYGGWFWLQSKGDKETLNKSRRIIIYAILGLIVMTLSFVAVNVLSNAFTRDSVIGR